MSQHKLPECPACDAIPDEDQCNVSGGNSISPTSEEEVSTQGDVPITAEEEIDPVHDITSIPSHPDDISEDTKRVQQLHPRQSHPLCSAPQDKLLAPTSYAEDSIVSQRQQSTQEVEDLRDHTKENQEDSEKDEMQSVDLQTHFGQGNPVSIRKRSSNSGSYCLLASNSSSSVDVREVISRFNSLNDEWEQAGSDQTSVRGKISRISGTSSFHSSITPAMDIPRISDILFEINSVDNEAMATNVKSAYIDTQIPKDIRTINEEENGDDNRPQTSPPEVVQIIQSMVTNVVKDGDPENQENVPPESSPEHNQLDGGKQIVVIKREEIARKFKDSDWLCPTCGDHNWDWKVHCNKCSTRNPSSLWPWTKIAASQPADISEEMPGITSSETTETNGARCNDFNCNCTQFTPNKSKWNINMCWNCNHPKSKHV